MLPKRQIPGSTRIINFILCNIGMLLGTLVAQEMMSPLVNVSQAVTVIFMIILMSFGMAVGMYIAWYLANFSSRLGKSQLIKTD